MAVLLAPLVVTKMRVSAFAFLAVLAALGNAQTTGPVDPQKAAQIPTGVVPLPSGPPSTAQQSPLPNPAKPPRPGDKPLAWSPKLDELNGFVAKQPISMEQAIAIALYTSRPFASAVANLEQASGRAGETRAQLFPNLGVNENLTYYDKATTVALAPGQPSIVVLPQFNPVFTASVNLPIDLFGTLRSAASQAQFNEVAARVDVNRVRNQVAYDVKNAFYTVLRASAQVAVAQDSLGNALERLDDANKNYAAGTTSRFDIITAQRDVADAQQNLITARAQVSVNLSNLKNTMGLDIAARLSISNEGAVQYPEGVVPLPPPPPAGSPAASPPPNLETPHAAPPLEGLNGKTPGSGRDSAALNPIAKNVVNDDFDFGPDYNNLLSDALKNRPEILEAEAKVTAGHKGLQYALRSELPSFSFAVEDIYTANATPLERKNQEALVLGISVPIFDGGMAKAAEKEQRGVIAQAEVDRRQARDQVQVDVQQAYIALVQSRQRVAVANVEVYQARESYRVSRVRYRAGVSEQTGVSPQLELSNAQTSLAQAESNLVNALYDYNNARAQLDRATGRYGFTGAGPGYKNKADIPHGH